MIKNRSSLKPIFHAIRDWVTHKCLRALDLLYQWRKHLALLWMLLIVSKAHGIPSVYQVSFPEASNKVLEPLGLFMVFLQKICWVLGGAFVIGAVVQYLQYRQNSGQTPISRPIILGLLGLLLAFLPFIVSYE